MRALLLASVVAFAGVGLAEAASVTTPIGLAAGSTYRLIFITSDGTVTTSTSISTYNTFAANEAALDPSLPSATWYAIASTASITAASNIGSCGSNCQADPIYLVTGGEVAANQAALFAGGNIALLNAVDIDENGNTTSGVYVATGTKTNGTIGQDHFGSDSPGPVLGDPQDINSLYINTGIVFSTTDAYPVYAISGELTVPAVAVPEPASLALLGMGVVSVVAARRRRVG